MIAFRRSKDPTKDSETLVDRRRSKDAKAKRFLQIRDLIAQVGKPKDSRGGLG